MHPSVQVINPHPDKSAILLALIPILIAAAALVAEFVIRAKKKNLVYEVKEVSLWYRDIAELNQKHTFYILDFVPEHTVFVKSRAAFNNFDFDSYLLNLAEDHTARFDEMFFSISENRRILKEYHEELVFCSGPITREVAAANNLDFEEISQIEYHLVHDILAQPATDIQFSIHLRYSENHSTLHAVKTYDYDDLYRLRHRLKCIGPVETHVEDIRNKNADTWQQAVVHVYYNAEDDFQQ